MKPGAEQSFLYGNHIMKSGLGRITENTPQYQGVVVYSMADVPLVITSVIFNIMHVKCFSSTTNCSVWVFFSGTYVILCLLCFTLQGFGAAAKTTQECRKTDTMSIVVFHQADIGEYIRSEDTLT